MSTSTRPAITIRSVLFGLLGILIMSGLAGYHDNIRQAGPLMIGNHLPGGAVTYLVFVGLVWNGIAGRISRRLALSQKELAVVLCATFVACFPPTSGMCRYLQRTILFPWYHLPGHPAWSEFHLFDFLRPELFPTPYIGGGVPLPGDADYAAYQTVYQGYFLGLSSGSHTISLADVPFRAWLQPLAYWGPLVFLIALSCLSILFVVHRQWAHHEQLSYPLAQVTSRFCHREDGLPGVPDLFRNRLFWWGFTPVLLLYLLEFLGAKYPGVFPTVHDFLPNLRSWWVPLNVICPDIYKAPGWWNVCGQSIFFTVIGVAYFTSTEISLTMGLNSIVLVIAGIAYYHVVGTPISGGQMSNLRAGAYFGYTLVLLYTGRAYFRAVFATAFGFGRRAAAQLHPEDAAAVLAARVLVLSFSGILVVMHRMGLGWTQAFLYTTALLMLYFIFTRILSETGIPFLSPDWNPNELMVSLFGTEVLGTKGLVLGQWLHNAVAHDPRENLMPYVAMSTKVADDNGMKLRRVYLVILASVVIAMVVAFVTTTYTQYNVGGMAADPYAASSPIVSCFNNCARQFQEMADVGVLQAASEGTFWSRLPLAHGTPLLIQAFLAGAVLVVVFSVLRFKYSRFPIHPILFLVWGSWATAACWCSFFIGWFVKTLIVRMGGGGVYQRMKPLFIGLIAGECVFIGFHIAYTLLYKALFGIAPTTGVFVLPI